jgi:hypothetical protein
LSSLAASFVGLIGAVPGSGRGIAGQIDPSFLGTASLAIANKQIYEGVRGSLISLTELQHGSKLAFFGET